MKFKIGDRVISEWDYKYAFMKPEVGQIISIIEPVSKVTVEWETLPKSIEKPENLVLETKVIKKRSDFQEEFLKIKPIIDSKIKNLTSSFEEVNDLLSSCGLSLFDLSESENLKEKIIGAAPHSRDSWI